MATTSWLIGSWHEWSTSLRVELNGNTVEILPDRIATDKTGFYLYHTTAALSLISLFQLEMVSEGIVGAAVRILKNRKVRISATNNFTVNWTSTLLKNILGFDGDLAGSNSYIAENISPLLWSASKPESPAEAPLNCLGRTVYDTKFSTAPDGTQVSSSSYDQIINTFNWNFVPMSRFQTDANLEYDIGGEYITFFDWVLNRANKFYLWRNIEEDDSSTSQVTWTNALGPYGFRPTRNPISPGFQRPSQGGLDRVDRRCVVSLDCLITPEWNEP